MSARRLLSVSRATLERRLAAGQSDCILYNALREKWDAPATVLRTEESHEHDPLHDIVWYLCAGCTGWVYVTEVRVRHETR